MTALTFPRETTEFVALDVKVEGVAVTNYQVTVLPSGQRPVTGWAACAALEAEHGVMISGLTWGVYVVWVRVSDNPETPVIQCCTVVMT